MRHSQILLALLSLLFFLIGCSDRSGTITGRVTPPSAGIHVAISQDGKTSASIDADGQTGEFTARLRPGTYDISVSVPAAQFPIQFSGIAVQPGKTTSLPPIDLGPQQSPGKSMLTGHVIPGAQVTLYQEGKERATVNAAADGNYAFTELNPGSYMFGSQGLRLCDGFNSCHHQRSTCCRSGRDSSLCLQGGRG